MDQAKIMEKIVGNQAENTPENQNKAGEKWERKVAWNYAIKYGEKFSKKQASKCAKKVAMKQGKTTLAKRIKNQARKSAKSSNGICK